jgi:hypothetical protein
MFALLDTLFGCRHRHLTFPITQKRTGATPAGTAETYVVCLDCGNEFPYDWREMKMASRSVGIAPLGTENHCA